MRSARAASRIAARPSIARDRYPRKSRGRIVNEDSEVVSRALHPSTYTTVALLRRERNEDRFRDRFLLLFSSSALIARERLRVRS